MAVEEGKLSRGLRVNSAVLANTQHTRPNAVRRANSYHLHSNHAEPRTSEDLRQTTLRRGLSRGNSSTKIDVSSMISRGGPLGPKNKNIPMVAAPPVGRPGENRWGTYSLNQPVNNVLVPERKESVSASQDSKATQKASISPLTQIQQPSVPQAGSVGYAEPPINRYEDFRVDRASRGSSRSSVRDYKTSEKYGRFPEKKSDHNSMFSLAHMGRSDTEIDTSGDERATSNIEHSEEKTPDFEDTYEENYEDAYLQIPGLAHATSVLDFMKDVGENSGQYSGKALGELSSKSSWDASFEKSMPSLNTRSSVNRPTTRTHQKVLDMKTLLLQETSNASQGHPSLPHQQSSSVGTATFGMSQEYAVKIQHESISSQWTQIRLRFSSRPESKKDRASVTCRAGILGSLQRQKQRLVDSGSHEKHMSDPETDPDVVTRDNVGSFLSNMWNDAVFETSTAKSPESSETHLYENTENAFTERSPNMLAMAKNAMMSRT